MFRQIPKPIPHSTRPQQLSLEVVQVRDEAFLPFDWFEYFLMHNCRPPERKSFLRLISVLLCRSPTRWRRDLDVVVRGDNLPDHRLDCRFRFLRIAHQRREHFPIWNPQIDLRIPRSINHGLPPRDYGSIIGSAVNHNCYQQKKKQPSRSIKPGVRRSFGCICSFGSRLGDASDRPCIRRY